MNSLRNRRPKTPRQTAVQPSTPVVSVIVPVYREQTTINNCLTFLSRCRRIGQSEVIVVDGDNGSTLRAVDPKHRIVAVHSPPGRGVQLNRGAAVAGGRVLVFVHVDTRPPLDFIDRIVTAAEHRPAGAFDLQISSPNALVRLIGLVGRLRSRVTRVPYGDQVQFITADLFRSVGGFPPTPIMEDVALMDELKRRRIRISLLRPPARTSDRRWRTEGAIRATVRNWQLMIAYRRGADPHRLVRRYPPHHR